MRRMAVAEIGGKRKRIQRRRALSSDGRCGVEIARETEEGCKGRIEGLEGREEGIGKMEERRGEKGAGNRKENKERGKERVRGTVVVKEGQREGGMLVL